MKPLDSSPNARLASRSLTATDEISSEPEFMFDPGDIIDGKYRVDGLCSDSGGMGAILFVTPMGQRHVLEVVLKYCKDNNDEQLKRFCREVRLLGTFAGNSKVVQIVDRNLDHVPPYFVMKYYPEGDLSKLAPTLQGSHETQERSFLQMIDCLQELHSRNEFHRDIKPHNFLLEDGQIIVSDFGLTTEVGSETAFTRRSMYWGTHGYIPPEFLDGGFKYADASGDIFMLGKTMYVLLTGREPMYIVGNDLPPPIFHIIERCCSISKTNRYQTLAELKQSLVAAYDVLLGRAGSLGKVRQLLSAIQDGIEQNHTHRAEDLSEFIEQLGLLDQSDQIHICHELSSGFFTVIAQQPFVDQLPTFLTIYDRLVEGCNYAWSYAETIANNMRAIFDGDGVPFSEKARALDLAIRAAFHMNRFAAMGTCRSMIMSIRDEALGLHAASVLLKNRDTFASEIEASECQSDTVRNALRQIQKP
jgi:serine/threonine protein kinase